MSLLRMSGARWCFDGDVLVGSGHLRADPDFSPCQESDADRSGSIDFQEGLKTMGHLDSFTIWLWLR